jgi:hypothetical protein
MGSLGKNLGIKTMSEAQVANEAPVKSAGSVVTSENLAEFTANKLGLATEESPTAAEVDENPSEPAAEVGQSEQDADEEAKATDEGKKPNPKLEKRFSELTKARKQAEESAAKEREAREALEARLATLEGQRAPQQAPQTNEKPRPEQFTDAFEYAEELAKWSAEQAVARREQEEVQKKAEEQKQQVFKTWNERLEAVKADLPDYEDMVASSSVTVNDTVRDAIIESDVGPRILYELASDDELAESLSKLTTAGALKLIGKLEARFEAKADEPEKQKPVVKKSNAPEPINPIRATGGALDVRVDTKGEYQGSYRQWKADRKAGKIK